jgi:hypothetical protein
MSDIEGKVLDEKTTILNKLLGLGLVIIGVYGLVYSYKIFQSK